jgi:hypothetical protein
LIVVAVGMLRDGHAFATGPENCLTGILVALVFTYAQVCALRIGALKRELRGLPPRL